MSQARKSKSPTRNVARLTRDVSRSEDDAEQALKEIAVVQAKLAGRGDDSARDLREKRTKSPR
jgi:ABC-type tungstate transport system permease subunit